MVLSHEEAEEIKKHLLKQLGNFPEEKREEIRKKVEEIPSSHMEEFVKEHKLTHLANQCIFCAIIAGKMPSFKIGEDSSNAAILEINPLSKGHTLIVPKSHEESLGESTQNFAKKIAQLLAKKLAPEEIRLSELKIMDHALLEVIPLFGNEEKRWQASEDELKALQEEILRPSEPINIERPKEEQRPKKPEPLYRLPPRIP